MTLVHIRVPGTYNLPLLCEELHEAHPHWVDAEDKTEVVISESTNGVLVRAPAEDEKQVVKICRKHDPTADSKNQKKSKDKVKLVTSIQNKLGLTDDEMEIILQ